MVELYRYTNAKRRLKQSLRMGGFVLGLQPTRQAWFKTQEEADLKAVAAEIRPLLRLNCGFVFVWA